jgi:hypothetical protein
MSNLKDKLIKIERTINIYNKKNELIREVDIEVPIDKLKEIIQPNQEDPGLYDGYKLDIEQLELLNIYLKEKIIPSFKNYSYFLITGGIYDWNKEV